MRCSQLAALAPAWKNNALRCGQVDERGFEIRALDVALFAEAGGAGDGRRCCRRRLEFDVLLQLVDERFIHLLRGGFVGLLEGSDEGVGEDVFGFEFPAGHVKRDGEDTMAVTLVGIAALLGGGNLGEVQDQPCVVGFESAQCTHLFLHDGEDGLIVVQLEV